MQRYFKRFALTGLGILSLVSTITAQTSQETQVAQAISPTPVQFIIPSATAQPTDMVLATATPTYTPSPEGPPQLFALPNEFSQPVNVRAEPDPNAEIVGTLDFNTGYEVTGRYFSWWQIRFNSAPRGVAYVFESVVEVIANDPLAIPEIDPFSTDSGSGESTAEPGSTADADRVLAVPTVEGQALTLNDGTPQQLPTFTPPPELVGLAPMQRATQGIVPTPDAFRDVISNVATTRIPPIFPILMLGGFGLLGILIVSFRNR